MKTIKTDEGHRRHLQLFNKRTLSEVESTAERERKNIHKCNKRKFLKSRPVHPETSDVK